MGPEFVPEGSVGLGSRVTLLDARLNTEVTYSVLGPWDADPERGIVSYRSPLGQALLGHDVGEDIVANLPGGTENFRIVSITSHFEES